VIDKSRDDRQDHYSVNPAEPWIDDVGRGRDDNIEIAGHQRLHRRRTGAEKDGLDQQTLLR